jgi:CHASE2 domain-containing sensor protein
MISALSALVLAVVAVGFSQTSFFHMVSLWAQDTNVVARSPQRPLPILLIMGDQKALHTFPEVTLFWRRYWAEAVRTAVESGAKVIGLDVDVSIPLDSWEPDTDRLLAEAVIESPVPVTCAAPLLSDVRNKPVPVNMVEGALGLSAFATLTEDPDGVIRRQELREAPAKDPADLQPMHSIALKVAEKFVNGDAVFNGGRLLLSGRDVPIGADRRMNINFAIPPDRFPRVSLADFLGAYRAGKREQLRDWVRGRAVLIGLDTFNDSHTIPIHKSFPGLRESVPSMEIHASALRTLLEADYLVQAPRWTQYGTVFLVLTSTFFIAVKLRIGLAIRSTIAELAIIPIGTYLLFRFGWILPGAELILALIVSLLAGIACRLFRSTKGKLSTKSAPA